MYQGQKERREKEEGSFGCRDLKAIPVRVSFMGRTGVFLEPAEIEGESEGGTGWPKCLGHLQLIT